MIHILTGQYIMINLYCPALHKVTKESVTPLKTTVFGSSVSAGGLMDIFWIHLRPQHSAVIFVHVFPLYRLQEQEQALNLSIKEATAKVSRRSTRHHPPNLYEDLMSIGQRKKKKHAVS